MTTPLTGSGDYHSWSQAMIIALDAKNKTGFVDGSLPRLPSDDLLFVAWKHCNSMVKSWLLNTISREFSNSLLCFQDAVEIWNDLKSRFLESDGPRVFAIKKNLANLNQGAMDVNTYYTRMKVLWDESALDMKMPQFVLVLLSTPGFLVNNAKLFSNFSWA